MRTPQTLRRASVGARLNSAAVTLSALSRSVRDIAAASFASSSFLPNGIHFSSFSSGQGQSHPAENQERREHEPDRDRLAEHRDPRRGGEDRHGELHGGGA